MGKNRKTVVFVDDCEDARFQYNAHFGDEYNVVLFNNPESFLEELKDEFRYCVLFTDRSFRTRLGGDDVIRASMKAHPEVPVYFLSGYCPNNAVVEGKEIKSIMKGCIRKGNTTLDQITVILEKHVK